VNHRCTQQGLKKVLKIPKIICASTDKEPAAHARYDFQDIVNLI
jgi:hypothetical protein